MDFQEPDNIAFEKRINTLSPKIRASTKINGEFSYLKELDEMIIPKPENSKLPDNTDTKNQRKRMNSFSSETPDKHIKLDIFSGIPDYDSFTSDQEYEMRCIFEQKFCEIRRYFPSYQLPSYSEVMGTMSLRLLHIEYKKFAKYIGIQ
jgi:hypothetical protein